METASTIVPIPVSSAMPTAARHGVDDRLIRMTATYQLTENGRKASLLAGGDGRAVQHLTLEVPGSRLHLVSVDGDGVARLKLRPYYTLDAAQRIVRTDAPPIYEGLPAVDDLLRDAARNHQLERAYVGERTAEREKRREISRELKQRVAQEFLNDPAQRAVAHPPPLVERCAILTPKGKVHFDAKRDEGAAVRVPAEAYRRFRADLRARADQRRQNHLSQVAVYEEKKRFVAEWVATKGTPDQKTRHAAGALPTTEVIEALTDEAFAPLAAFPRYTHDGAERLQEYLRRLPRFADVMVTSADLAISVEDSKVATEAQWALMNELRNALPDATRALRAHRLVSKRLPTAPALTVFGVRLKLRVGPFVVFREYAAPNQ